MSISAFQADNVVLSILCSAHLVGQLCGAMMISSITKKLDNRRTIIVFGVLSLGVTLLTYIPVHWAFWATMRVLIGVTQ